MIRPLLLACPIIFHILVMTQQLYAQRQPEIDSLMNVLKQMPEDTNKVLAFHRVSYLYNFVQYKPELARPYADSAMALSERINHNRMIIDSHYYSGLVDMNQDNYAEALEHFSHYINFY